MLSSMRRLLGWLCDAAGVVAAGFLVVLFVLMVAMSGGRQFGLNIPAGDDFAAWAMVAVAFLGLAHTYRRGEMIRVGFLIERFTGRARRALELFCLTVGLAFVAFFARHAFQLSFDSWRFDDMSQGTVAVPLWIPQIAMVIGLVLLALAMLDDLVRVIAGGRAIYEKDPPKTAEELIERVAQGGGV